MQFQNTQWAPFLLNDNTDALCLRNDHLEASIRQNKQHVNSNTTGREALPASKQILVTPNRDRHILTHTYRLCVDTIAQGSCWNKYARNQHRAQP
jgi:hypothetical protein